MSETDELVARLRRWANFGYGTDASEAMEEAADTIERLQAENARLRTLGEGMAGIRWISADKDNMEFAARITYSQMADIRIALAAWEAGR